MTDTITLPREVVEQALDALKSIAFSADIDCNNPDCYVCNFYRPAQQSIDALRVALDAPPNPLSYEQADTMLKAREVKP